MHPVKATIKPGDTGSEVVNLQQALQLLYAHGVFKTFDPPNAPTTADLNALIQALASERQLQAYGQAAQSLIKHFQIQQGLGDNLHGVVEESTAKRLNELLLELSAPIETNYLVTGTIINAKTHSKLSGLVVRAFDADGAIRTALGKTQTDAKGNYRINFESSAFQNTKAEHGGPDLIVEVSDESGEVELGQSKRLNNCAATTVIDLAIDVPTLCVFGTVTSVTKQTQENVIVTAWDRDLRKRQLLGTATTDQQGDYAIAYRSDQFSAADIPNRKTPWLVIEVQREKDGKIEKSVELKPAQVKTTQRVDFRLEALPTGKLTEWEEVTRVIKPLLIGQGENGDNLSPSALTPNDVQFVSTETNIGTSVINAWSASYAMQQTAIELLLAEHATEAALVGKLGWSLFYGLCRQLSASTLQSLQSRTPDALTRAIDAAQQQRQIPVVETDDSIVFCKSVELLRQLQLIRPGIANLHPVAQITSVLGIDVSTKIKLAALATMDESSDHNPDALFSLHKDFPNDTHSVNRLIQGMRLHKLSDGNPLLMKSLDSHLSNDGDSIVSLAGLAVSDWNNVATQSNVSTPVAMSMLNKIELAYPIEAFQSRIKSQKLPSMSGEITKGIQKLLNDDPEKVRSYTQGRTRVLNTIDDAAEKTLNSLGLFGRLGLPYEVGSVLVAANIDTPDLLIKHGRETIFEMLRDKYGDVAAKDWSDKTIKTIEDVNVIGTDVIQGSVQYQYIPHGWYIKPEKPTPEVRENIPNIPALLGDLDECSCPPCESMLGQPAYLVDLLQLLSKQNAQKQKPIDYLRSRRRDIFELPLGCEQADSEVLHIDLAIEIMEKVAISNSHNSNHGVALAALYKQLANQPYPWFLPYDKPLATRTAYLNKLGIDLGRLDELTQQQFNANQIAANVLGIPYSMSSNPGSTEWTLLTQTSQGTALWELYGFTPNAQGNVSIVDPVSNVKLSNQPITQVIRRVSVLLDRTGLGLDAFEELLQQPYIGNLSIDNRAQCKTSEMRLNVGNQVLESCLDGIHRMVRLQRHLKWSFTDINHALIMSPQGTSLSDIIIQIAQIKSLADTYHLPVNLLCRLPASYETILQTLAISRVQRLCLEKLLGLDLAQSPISLTDLKTLLALSASLEGIALSTEELGLLLLPRSDLQSIFPTLPKYLKDDAEIAASATKLIDALKLEQKQLQDSQATQTPPPLDDAAIVTLLATSLNISEQDAEHYAAFRISAVGTLIQLLDRPHTITANDVGAITNWLNCVIRLEGIRSKVDAAVFYGLLSSFDWITTTTASSATALVRSLVNWLWLAQPERMGPLAISEILKLAASNDSTKFNDVIDIFAKRLELASARIVGLAALVGLSQSTFDGFKNAARVKRLFELLSFAKQWQADSATITSLSSNNPSDTVASLLRAKYGYTDSEWTEVQRNIENPVRQQKRNALVAELIRRNPQFKNASDIYEHYLIDPLVEPCMKTTRVLEAVTATQLFAQRVLFGVENYRDNSNVEHTLIASQALKDQWTWMRNYRVWEANRKVLLFPENWLYPELRDDKSSSFKLLESELGKGELDGELANEAFGKFLGDVAQMGQMQVIGLYEDIDADATGQVPNITNAPQMRTVYVVGRTTNPTYIYYWRKCIDFGTPLMEWSPWSRIELDIQGDHVLPFILSGEFYIAWPLFGRPNGDSNNASEQRSITLKFAWSKWNRGAWSSIETSRDAIQLAVPPFTDERTGFAFRCSTERDVASVIAYTRASNTELAGTQTNAVLSSDPSNLTQTEIDSVRQDFSYAFRSGLFVPNDDGTSTLLFQSLSSSGPDASIGAMLLVEAEVWVKAKNSNHDEGYVRLSDSGSSYSCGLYFNIDEHFIGLPCYRPMIWVTAYANTALPSLKVAARLDMPLLNLSWFAGDFVDVTSTALGTKQSVKVRLVITPPTAPSLDDLGIADAREFKPAAEFVLNPGIKPSLSAEPASRANLFIPDGCTVFMNGYRGDEATLQAHSLRLHNTGTTSARIPFQAPYRLEQTTNDKPAFWVIGASTNQQRNGSPVWHYFDGQDGCFLDFESDARSATQSFQVYASGYDAAEKFRRAIVQSTNNLPTLGNQPVTFSAEGLPGIAPSGDNSRWQEQLQGKRAFDGSLPYACYNWEVFFHAPLFIADQLSKQHQFEDAERWLRYLFDPTSTEPGTDARRFLKFRVFKELDTHTQVIDDLKAIAQVASGYYNDTDVSKINNIIDRWRQLPFRPFVIARGRHIAFLWRTLFAYVDNLITWADSLYRRDTRESNNEAMMLYVLAYRILGRRPKQMAGTSKKVAHTYDHLAGKLDAFSNYWVDVATRAGGYVIHTGGRRLELVDKQPPTSVGGLLFCMPHNDKLDRYCDVIEERLFNLRHCRSIEGVARDLPLLDPPIDPELLIRATAAGLDLNSVVAGLYAAPPHYRYGMLAARATELAAETKSLGSAMLSAMEKRDAEQLSQLRSTNELSLLQQVGELKKLQIKEAEANITALRVSRRSAEARYSQYQRLLGLENTVPEEGASAGEVAMLGQLDKGNSSPRSGLGLISEEGQQYKGIEGANTWSTAAAVTKLVASGLHASSSIVAVAMSATPFPNPPKVLEAIGNSASTIGDSFSFVSQGWRTYAEQQGMLASHLRRRDEWAFQSNQVIKELKQIDKQILANQIRIDITKKELDNHQLQLEQSRAVDEVMRSKFTNVQLYDWMSKELYGLYNYAYRMALEMGRKAQRAAERELGLRTMTLDKISNGHWNSMKQGLLAGERLHQDLKRLDESYMDMNKREFELTKHISLRRLDPAALANLRITRTVDGERVNQCSIEIPEWLFDLDTPGHYLRRIKSVAISIPCVTGPYSSVNSKLTLLTSSIRYEKDPAIPLQDTLGATEAVVTSTANADSGMFETQLRDERFLPFEGRGVISTWRLELPAKYKQFDYATISDVILTLRYTARDGGDQLKQTALDGIPNVDATTPRNFSLLISCRSDFASDWVRAKADGTNLSIRFGQELLPYWMLNATPVSAKKMALVANIEPQFESITWNRTDPVQIGSVSNCEDMLVNFEVQLP